MKINEPITRFLLKQTCATICCIDKAGLPSCFSCFYVFNPVEGLLYFKSSAETEHAGYLSANPFISATVLPDSLNKLIVKGIQLQGAVLNNKDSLAKDAVLYYHTHNPMAVAMKGDVYSIRIDTIKMTDSSRVFGKKIRWERKIDEKRNGYIEFENINHN